MALIPFAYLRIIPSNYFHIYKSYINLLMMLSKQYKHCVRAVEVLLILVG